MNNTIADSAEYINLEIVKFAASPSFSDLVSVIVNSDRVYTFLIYFYLDEISAWQFQQEMQSALETGIPEREYLSSYFASRIIGEDCFDKLIRKIIVLSANK